MGRAPGGASLKIRGHEHRPAVWWAWATLRSFYAWTALAILTLVIGALYILALAVLPSGGRVVRGLERAWVGSILFASNAKVVGRGLERVRPGESYIVMANHRSMYDIPVVHYLLGKGRDLRWIGKQELVKVPIFGLALSKGRHIAIDRFRRERGIAALKRAASESAEGVSFVIMPEGTRSPDSRLLPFKKGPFHLAIDTGLSILPVAILGSEILMSKGRWWILPGRIELKVLPPIPTAGLDKSALEALRDRVREAIRAALPDLPEGDASDSMERSST